MTRQHEDFIFQAEPASTVPPATSTQRARNELAHKAASAAYRIRSTEPDPRNWGPLIAAEPEEIRECLREYLAQAYRAMQRRDRDKRSAAGDAELAKMGELARRL